MSRLRESTPSLQVASNLPCLPRMLYDWLVSQGRDPLIVDATDLLANPEEVMAEFCKECGVDFKQDMCEWKGGEQEHFRVS